MNTIANNKGVSVFPNPAADNITVQWAGQSTATATVTIADMTGREVLKTKIDISAANGHALLHVAGLNNGIYLISIATIDTFYCNKLVIEK